MLRWHDHDPNEIQQHVHRCITVACESLEASGWATDSVKVIGNLTPEIKSHTFSLLLAGITNQRETTVAWSRKSGKPLCNAIVWDDSRTKNTVA